MRVSIGEGLKGAARVGSASAACQRAHAEGLALLCEAPIREPAPVLGPDGRLWLVGFQRTGADTLI